MWVYDGEEWTNDDGDERPAPRPEPRRPTREEWVPRLQVVEIAPASDRTLRRPPFPPR